jgi:DNA adenine methylase
MTLTIMGIQTRKRKITTRLDYELPECYPFVKWAGGKAQLLHQLNGLIPKDFESYLEPFVGGAAFFFHLTTRKNLIFKSVLSDINQDLINAYKVIKDNVEDLITILRVNEKGYNKNPTKYYYELRANLNPLDNVQRAARFITLNKTCYNGLYRVNNKGIFNVPIGRYKHPLICDAANLRNINLLLRTAEIQIESADYKSILLEKSKKNDFIYLDPPYSPVSSTSNFTAYTHNRFTEEDQRDLADIFRKLDRRGCFVLLSNSNSPFIENLYDKPGISMTKVNVMRAINSKASKRTGHKELLIRNYE